MSFSDFIDERMLISHDVLGKKEMKIKVLELSDETAPSQWKLGDRVKVNKILITIKHLETQEIEEINELVKKKQAIYDLRVDKRVNKVGNGVILENFEMKKLPNHINDNIDKYKNWLD